MTSPQKRKSPQTFQPHETARMQALMGTPLASFGARAAAFGLDFSIATLIYVPAAILVRWLLGRGTPNLHIEVHVDFHDAYSLVFLVCYFGITLYAGRGQTLGKRLLGIRVVSLTRTRITLWQSIERALGYGASMLEGGFGFLQYFMNPNRCCVHDRIAETIVAEEPALEMSPRDSAD